jgi:ABC-type branched-subunit amino acid transport system ATPase component
MTVWENLEMGAYRKDARAKIPPKSSEILGLFPKLAERKHQIP